MTGNSESTIDYTDVVRLESRCGIPIDVLRAVYRAQVFHRHFHDTFTVGLGLRGASTIWYRGQDHPQMTADVVVIPPGEVHTGAVNSRGGVYSYMAVYIPESIFGSCAEVEEVDPRACDYRRPIFQADTVAAALRNLHALFWSGHIGPCDMTAASLSAKMSRADDAIHMIVATLIRRLGKTRADPPLGRRANAEGPLVRRVREILEDCYSDPSQTSLRAISRRVGVSPFHIVRVFTRAMGLSPHNYLLQVRVRSAQRFLASGESPSTVAALAGFADQSHLTVHFKRHTGVTPAHYQRCLLRR